MQNRAAIKSASGDAGKGAIPPLTDDALKEYIACMASNMAVMVRNRGRNDEELAALLDRVAQRAGGQRSFTD